MGGIFSKPLQLTLSHYLGDASVLRDYFGELPVNNYLIMSVV